MAATMKPTPLQVLEAIVTERELRRVILDVIESRCSSFALDDDADAQRCAETIAAALASQGVRL